MRLSEYLKKHKIEQQDFAQTIKTNAANVSRYVARLRMPRPLIAMRIVKATGGEVTLQDIYG
jgi:hypothetical protein